MGITVTIDPQTPMEVLLREYPGARRALFRRYHIGGCSSCGFAAEETLAQVCERNQGLAVEEVAAHIMESHASDLQMQFSPAEAQAALAEAPGARLLDIRTREEFDAVHVPGALFFTQELMQEAMGGWSREGLLVLIDHTGTRSMDAAAYFAGHGFVNVRAVRGGIDAWSEQVDPSLPRYELE